ncbi:MOSC domain-containing protein [Desulfotalea psychrophila]|uniref:MOSC domain-containing protein n=1 Tax=Desulfotalea psychrophila (strain LSv54 / DSM 12343) TaxID=177439 RepID=Q6ANU7_DESPS|nr:MOSC domain-containing protein [Desulfotalea psychrophila]CAG35977.1 hypothetical protein DP1248 [Desulfotalea psychrophila LSv54]
MRIEKIAYKEERGQPMLEVATSQISLEAGLAGDISGKPGTRQITLLSADVWQEVCAELSEQVPWTVRRANLLVAGVRFKQSDVGRILHIGDVQIEITRETVPCKLMDAQVSGLLAALNKEWRGGVCGRVVAGGNIEVGDNAHWA